MFDKPTIYVLYVLIKILDRFVELMYNYVKLYMRLPKTAGIKVRPAQGYLFWWELYDISSFYFSFWRCYGFVQ